MRVLVVEDEVRQAAALTRGLEAGGFAVDVANNGNDGLWLATERSHDVIVLDVMLPGLNGFLSKPFSYVVLVARLRALLRRGATSRPRVLEVGNIELDVAATFPARDSAA